MEAKKCAYAEESYLSCQQGLVARAKLASDHTHESVSFVNPRSTYSRPFVLSLQRLLFMVATNKLKLDLVLV